MNKYRVMLAHHGAGQSMSGRRNCFGNALIGSFFRTINAQYAYLATLDSSEALKAGPHDYIRYYNRERIKLGLQVLSPVEYRLRNTA